MVEVSDAETKRLAVERLSIAMKHMGEPPESFLAMLDRLDVPWVKEEGNLIIKWSDFLAGEQRNPEQGSILKRLYGSGADNTYKNLGKERPQGEQTTPTPPTTGGLGFVPQKIKSPEDVSKLFSAIDAMTKMEPRATDDDDDEDLTGRNGA